MIVPCPYCATRYNIDDARLTGPSPMLKCSRCRRVFPAPRPKKQATEAAAPKTEAAAEKSLPLPFDEPGWNDEPPAAGADLTIPEPEERYTLGADGPPDALVVPPDAAADVDPRDADSERETVRHAAPVPLPSEDPEHEEHELDADVERDPDEGQDERPARRPPAQRRPARTAAAGDSERSKVWALMIFLAAVLASYGMLTRALFASPHLSDRLLSRVPLIGASTDQRLLTRKVALADVTGSYQRIKDGKQVFIVSGKALNTASVALRSVQIIGKLFDTDGRQLDEKVIFCGNSITIKMLKSMTPPGISILQGLQPAPSFSLEPGGSAPFVIVFMDPPHDAAEFSTQVTAVQHHA